MTRASHPLPERMHVVVAAEPGGPEVLAVASRDVPRPGPGEVLLRVAAAGVNRADLMQRAGAYPGTPSTDVLGLEVSGVVVDAGPGAPEDLVGREGCALLPGGGYADHVVVRAAHTAPVPRGVSVQDAAGIVETAATVWSNVFMDHPPRVGSWMLVHGGASGIGALAVQLAGAFGVKVATTVSSADKRAFVEGLGADLVVEHRRQDFAEVLLDAGIRPSTVVDIVGGPYLERNLQVLARRGRLVVIGHLGGPTGTIDLSRVLVGDLTLTGSGLRMRPDEEKDRIVDQLVRYVWPLYERGVVRPTTHATFPLGRAALAHELLERSDHQGKVLLVPEHDLATTPDRQS